MQDTKFRRIHANLQADVFCMQRQLAIILDENHLLKVKIRRLENEMTKKNKYIDYLHTNAEKHLQDRRLNYENSSGIVLKLRRENEELRTIISKRDLADQKKNIHMKTMLLYKQLDPMPIRKPLKKATKTKLAYQTSIGTEKSSSLADSHDLPKTYYRSSSRISCNIENSDGDYLKPPYIARNNSQQLLDMIKILKQQHIVDRNIIRSRNSDISRFLAELENVNVQLKVDRSIESIPLCEPSDSPSLKKLFAESVECEQTNRDSEINCSSLDYKKTILEPVNELSEEETFSEISHKSTTYSQKTPRRQKTQIEYVIDSEVSSDGEDIYLPNNILSSYHRRSTGTMPIRHNEDSFFVDE